jgi:pimeloyl-ACP methyl ester carboxylesterase
MAPAAATIHAVRPGLLCVVVIGLLTASACAPAAPVLAIDRLKPCSGGDAPIDAYCGSLRVFENRQTGQGRHIDLNIVVLPALSADARPDPLFVLAGGPGQGAAKMAKWVRDAYRRVQTDRDIVLVDQRGTGGSNPLNCESGDDSLAAFVESDASAMARLKTCMAGYDADLTLYTTTIAMDDLDDVRAYLGYDRVNLYGASYGTRAALVYMQRHGDHVRSAVLDGVAPTNMRLPLFFPRDSERAFALLVRDCEADAGCRAVYPDFGRRFRSLMARLAKAPPLVRVTHPRTGDRGEVRLEARIVANVIVMALYSPVAASLVPAIVARAEEDDFQGMLALASLADTGGDPNLSVGMQLSVICAEDAPRITPEASRAAAAGSLFGEYVMRAQREACGFWPRGDVAPSFYEPVTAPIPTLVLSGEIDPVTPPTWGEDTARHLPVSRHVVLPGTGHTPGATGCGLRIIRSFIEAGSVADLDTACAASLARPPFFLSPAGPDPRRAARPAQ